MDQLSGTAAGVPYLATPPSGGARPDAPVVIAYHLLDAPRTEEAFAAAVPLDGLDAWTLYLGLPMSGKRLPHGGAEELWRLIGEDAVLNVHQHVTLGALREFPAAYAEIRHRLRIDPDVPLGVMGGSMGGAVAQLVAAEGGLPVRAAVLINPVVSLRPSIDAIAATHGMTYTWSAASDAVAERVDFLSRADELAGTAIRFIVGADDMVDAILDPVDQAVRTLGADRQIVPGMAHALAAEPGTEAAPQTEHARIVDRLAVEWFTENL